MSDYLVKSFYGKKFGFYKTEEEPDEGIFQFDVLSDIHITTDDPNDELSLKFGKATRDIKEKFPKSKALLVCGDFAESNDEEQFKGYFNILNENKDRLEFITAIGNHQVRWLDQWKPICNRYINYNKPYMGENNDNIYFDKWINGYHFIVMNTEWNIKDRAYISKKHLNWLDEKIAEGYEDGKPVFLILHQPLRGTFWNSNEWDEGVQDFEIKEVLRKYPRIILFSGHIHNGLGTLDILKKKYGIMVDVPGFRSNDQGDSRGQIRYRITVYQDKVQISLYDYLNHRYIKGYNYIVDLNSKYYSISKFIDYDLISKEAFEKVLLEKYNKKKVQEVLEIIKFEDDKINFKNFEDFIMCTEKFSKISFDDNDINKDFSIIARIKLQDEVVELAFCNEELGEIALYLNGREVRVNEIENKLSQGFNVLNIKTYKDFLEKSEIESAYNPFVIKVERNKAIISWTALIDEEIEVREILVNKEERISVPQGESYISLTNLEAGKEYELLILTIEKVNKRNVRDVYQINFITNNLN